ncbi:MAG: NHL repeat-containing protein [Candidatus Calescibacterium sp.]|nr:NHL repeat-containing protein [Candidatus Calescibacterium sp.]MCX7972814.1 NHL repeat-containing protein [bacterium]MDW8195198.1 NHL repeat-containing protein [Candidatus Calescibacterium sp.]
MFNKVFLITNIIIIILIILGGAYIFFFIFGGKTGINIGITYNYEWEDLDPTSFAFDPILKSFYIADNFSKTVKKYSLSEEKINFVVSIGREGNGVGEFRQPFDIEVDKNNFVYVLDFYLSKLVKMDNYGKVLWEFGKFGNSEKDLANPRGIGLDKIGFIYIADTSNNRIVKIDLDGNFSMLFGKEGKEPFQFSAPSDVAVDSKGYILVADTNNDRIQIFDSNANFITYTNYENQLKKPQRIYISDDDTIYIIAQNTIIKANMNKIQKIINPFFDRKKYKIIDILKWADKLYILYFDTQSKKGGIKIKTVD